MMVYNFLVTEQPCMCLFLILRFSNSPTLDINMNCYVFAYDSKLHVSCMAERHLFTLRTM